MQSGEMQIPINGKRYSVFLQNGSCMYSFELPRTLVITTFVSQELGWVLAKVNLCFTKRWVVVSAVEQFREWSIIWNVTIGL